VLEGGMSAECSEEARQKWPVGGHFGSGCGSLVIARLFHELK
jgi:hypothetical protein